MFSSNSSNVHSSMSMNSDAKPDTSSNLLGAPLFPMGTNVDTKTEAPTSSSLNAPLGAPMFSSNSSNVHSSMSMNSDAKPDTSSNLLGAPLFPMGTDVDTKTEAPTSSSFNVPLGAPMFSSNSSNVHSSMSMNSDA